jgi:vacuolar-type H+-ATPase subunit H
VNNLYNLGPNNTLAEYQNAQKAADAAYNKLAKAADKLSKSQNDSLNKTAKQLSEAVNAIPKKATIAEASDMVDDASAAALAAYVDITTTVCTYDID